MRIRLESGERLVVEVPVQLASSAQVAIQATPIEKPGSVAHPLVDVTIEGGLIGRIDEHVCHRHAVTRDQDRLTLWAHLVSAHATIVPVQATLDELIDMHEHEHNGPGTIRNHPRESREYSLKKIGRVLSESEP